MSQDDDTYRGGPGILKTFRRFIVRSVITCVAPMPIPTEVTDCGAALAWLDSPTDYEFMISVGARFCRNSWDI